MGLTQSTHQIVIDGSRIPTFQKHHTSRPKAIQLIIQ